MSKRSNIPGSLQGLTSLDAFIEVELDALEEQYGISCREAAERVLGSLLTEEGAPMSMTDDELRQRLSVQRAKASDVARAIESLLRANLIARPAPGTLRLGSNALAAALEQRFLSQYTLRREAAGLIRDKYQRRDLLSEKELALVEPHLAQLSLTAGEDAFVRKSQRAVKRRKWILWGAVLALILLLLSLLGLIYRNLTESEKAKAIETEARKAAEASSLRIQQQKNRLDTLTRELTISNKDLKLVRDSALASEQEARQQRDRAIRAERVAKQYAADLEVKNQNLSQEKSRAEAAELDAKEKAALAKVNADSADAARNKAEGLSLILKSRNIALSVPQLAEEDAERAAILAYQAYEVNKDNGQGDVYNSDIVMALYRASQALFKEKGFKEWGQIQEAAVTNIVRVMEGRYASAGTDGKVHIFGISDIFDRSLLGPYLEIVQKLASSPDGRWLLVCPRLGAIHLFDLQNDVSRTIAYPSKWGATDALFIPEENAFLIVGHAGGIHRLAVEGDDPKLESLGYDEQQYRAIGRDGKSFYLLGASGRMFFTDNSPLAAGFPAPTSGLGDGYSILATWPSDGYQYLGGMKTGDLFITLSPYGTLLVEEDEIPIRHKAALIHGEFSPDGQLLATLSRDGVARVIDLRRYFEEAATYQPILLDIDGFHITSLCFSADSQELLVGTKDGAIRRFYLDPGRYAHRICELLNIDGQAVDWEKPWRQDFKEKGAPKKCY